MAYTFSNVYGVTAVRDDKDNGPHNIRFINSDYKLLFTIPDGGQILVRRPGGEGAKAYTCRYIDAYHTLIGGSAYHICEFAECMERIHATYAPFPDKRVIWSNIDLDLKDWIDDLKAEYPGESEEQYLTRMYETNNDYLDDERINLKVRLDEDFVEICDIGRWDGRINGYKVYKDRPLSDILHSSCDYAEWYVDREGELRMREIHHDGTNYSVYRKFKPGTTDEQREELLDKIISGKATQEDIDRVTDKLGPVCAAVYGWDFPTPPPVRTKAGDAR